MMQIEKTKLSVIIPIYNCEKYIKECLESVCEQQMKEIQIICIDDCSQDTSLQEIQKVARKYNFVEIYENKKNIGLGATRNKGIQYALGKYVMFLDADDYIEKDILDKVILSAEEKDVDILLFDMLMFLDGGDEPGFNGRERIRKHKYIQQSGIEMLCQLIANKEMSGTACGGIYKKEYLNRLKITFNEDGQHEDIPFTFNALLNADKVCYLHEIVYHYRQRRESILHSPDYNKLLYGLIRGYTNMQSVWEKYKQENPCRKTDEQYINQYFHIIENMIEERYVHYLSCENVQTDEFITRQIQQFHFLKKNEVNRYISKEDFSALSGKADISIYGAGYYAKKTFLLLRKNDIKISRFYVTRTESNPSSLFEIPVEEYQPVNCHGCIIIAVSKKYQEDILKQMKLDGRKKVFLLNN